jgi:hypothetical protein
MPVALTNILHSGQWVDAGEEVTESTFVEISEEEMQALVDVGAVGDPPGVVFIGDSEEKLAQLDALLQEKYGMTADELLATEVTAEEPSAATPEPPQAEGDQGSSSGG